MSYRYEKETGDLVISGFETGIAPSPHKGMANMQAVNISTESGEIMCSYARVQQSLKDYTSAGASISTLGGNLFQITGANTVVRAGTWITVSGTSAGGVLPNGNYYVLTETGTNSSVVTLSSYYKGALFTYAGNATGTVVPLKVPGSPVAYAVETYTASQTTQYRYYVLDSQALVWVWDTNYSGSSGITWFLPDFSTSYYGSATAPSGIGVLNGILMVFAGNSIWTKPTVDLGGTTSTSTRWAQMTNAYLSNISATQDQHFVFVGHQGTLYYTDGQYLGSIFPNTSLLVSGLPNVQSYAKYTASTTTGTINTLIGGSIPSMGIDRGSTGFLPVPAVFFTDQAGTQPSNLSTNTVYYIAYSSASENFKVYASASDAETDTNAINIASGAAGNQYFNTFWVVGTHAGAYGDTSSCTFNPQRLGLPYGEIAQCMTEVGNNIIVGAVGNVLYPWNQIDPTPGSLIFLPESNTTSLVTVNQMAYIFTGNRGNVYITDGSVASLVIKVPDYCAGIAGTESSYVEPYFVWGGAAYIRGRVYFSILDQTSSKAGNCGGIWSFVPTQNLYIGQDTGLALRLENQNSYGTYSGVATLIIPSQTQNAQSPQFWSAWYSSTSSPAYGIDFTDVTPSTVAVIETDLIPVGTFLKKRTFKQIEYKLAAPLANGETVTIAWRPNATDSYTSAGTAIIESATGLSGYFTVTLEKLQWAQLLVSLTPLASSSSSFVRLSELRLR